MSTTIDSNDQLGGSLTATRNGSAVRNSATNAGGRAPDPGDQAFHPDALARLRMLGDMLRQDREAT